MIRINTFELLCLSLVVSLTSLSAIGCGGSSSSSGGGGGEGGGEVATGAGGEAIVTGSGAAVSAAAHNHWEDGLTSFNSYEEQGWNPARCEEVIEKFDEAIDAQRSFAEAHYMAGLTAERCEDQDKARRYYNQALQANDKLCEARVALGMMAMESGNAQQARSEFTRSIRDDPQCTTGYTNLAILQRRAGGAQEAEALSNLRRALAIDSSYLPAFNQMALLYYGRGVRGNAASFDLAEVVCRQAQLIDREYAPIYNTWGLIKIRKGDVIEALKYFEKAITLDDSMFEAQMNFGQITLSFRGYADAQRAFTRASALRADSYEAIVGLGAAHRGLEQFDQAQAQYERAVQLNGQRPEAYFNLGLLFHDYMSGSIPELERAKGFYEQFMQRASAEPRYAEAREAVSARCRELTERQRRRRRSNTCRPGRIQLIEQTIAAVREGEAMQAEAERMQAEMERQEAQQQQQQQQEQPAPAPE